MKTLVFSPRVVLDGMPAGFSGVFKMLHIETGQLYLYKVHIPGHIYVGTQIPGSGSAQEDLQWWQSMFYALTEFITTYNTVHGCLPTDQNVYQDRRPYTSERNPLGEKIHFMVERNKVRSLDDKKIIIFDITEIPPAFVKHDY